jgi:hypothetical protein
VFASANPLWAVWWLIRLRKEVKTMATVNTEAARAAFEAAGLKGDALDRALAGIASMRTTATIEVVVNSAEERKFGDVSIFKVQGNGYRKPAMGLFRDQISVLIEQLQAAQTTLSDES